MLIDLNQYKRHQFDQIIAKNLAAPEQYLDFDQLSDFFQAAWLAE